MSQRRIDLLVEALRRSLEPMDGTFELAVSRGRLTRYSLASLALVAVALSVCSRAGIDGPNRQSLPLDVGSVSVALNPTSIKVGAGSSATATVRDVNNDVITGGAVSWSSSDTTIAAVNAFAGLVTGMAAGSASITATSGGKRGAATITITTSGLPGPTTMFFNSSEPGCDGSDPNVLWCDDFERGYWFKTTADANNPVNAGWNGTPYGDVDPLGLNFGRCGGVGAGATSCAAGNGGYAGIGQARAMGDHSLSQSVTEMYFRYYVKPLLGYAAGQEKAITFNKGLAGVGGIYAGTVFYGLGATGSNPNPQPTFLEENHPGGPINLTQNQGNNFGLVTNHWNFIQVRLKFVAAGSDIVQMWMDDCGTTGTACTGSPTLRMSYSNETLRPAGDNSPSIGSIWIENWANPASVGEMYYDQIKVAKTPVGFKP